MRLTKWDFGISVSMAIAIISMSFVFPALGLTGSNIGANDIPQFNSSKNFDFIDEFPNNPGTPSSGTLIREHNNPTQQTSIIIEQEIPVDGVEMTLFNDNTSTPTQNPEAKVAITNWSDSNAQNDEIILNNVGENTTFNNFSYEIHFHFEKVENLNQPNMTMYVEWEILSQPSDQSFIGRIPIVGGLFSAGQQLASIVAWIGSIMFWFVGVFIETLLNLLIIVIDTFVYFGDMLLFLISFYTSIIGGAPSGWPAVFTLLPGIVLFLELAKMTYLTVDLLWIG